MQLGGDAERIEQRGSQIRDGIQIGVGEKTLDLQMSMSSRLLGVTKSFWYRGYVLFETSSFLVFFESVETTRGT